MIQPVKELPSSAGRKTYLKVSSELTIGGLLEYAWRPTAPHRALVEEELSEA